MGSAMSVAVRAIQGDDLPAVGELLHTYLNSRISAQTWASAPIVPWRAPAPNHGFLLEDGNNLVGAILAFYSTRAIDGVDEQFCNLGAWYVREEYRAHSIRMMKAILDQKGYTLTDLSPSGVVVPLNERLQFQHLDTTTALIPGIPYPLLSGQIRISSDPKHIQQSLTGAQLKIYLDHANAAAANHLLLMRGNETCYVIYRRDRRKISRCLRRSCM